MTNLLKNITCFSVDTLTPTQIQNALDDTEGGLNYTPCTESQAYSFGFDPDGALTSLEEGNFRINFIWAEKKIPSQVLHKALTKKVAALEEEAGRKLTKGERMQAKEDVLFELFKKAFVVEANVYLYFHAETGLLVCNNPKVAEACIGLVRKALGSIQTTTLHVDGVSNSLGKNLLACIDTEGDLALGRFGYASKLNLKGPNKETAKFTEDYVLEHIKELLEGDYVVTLARLESRGVSFDLTHELKIKSIKFDEAYYANLEEEFDEMSEYLLAFENFQLYRIAEVCTDLLAILKTKAEEYKC